MNEQQMLNNQVQRWQASGQWIDRGRWKRTLGGFMEYVPTKREIKVKCRLFRTIANWRGAHKRAPRGGEYAVDSTSGLK